jgi:flavin reductase (DIM6/NTAB) family NADH-FMN oxidoreductase RutF/rubredoxin
MDTNILRNIGYGMYVVCANKGKAINGQISNTVFQIASEPPTIAVSINKQNFTHGFIQSSRRFTVSILAEDTALEFIGKFGFKSGRDTDKFKDINFKVLASGCPVVLDNTLGYLEAEVISQMDAGTHTVFLGRVTAMEMLTTAKPMTYAYYHQVKRGVTPKTAPTFIKEAVSQKETGGPQKYRCTVCGYIYDPAVGDPKGNIAAGTLFEKLPAGWVCPVCGATKDKFVKIGG